MIGLPPYTPSLARELRAELGITEAAMCRAVGLSRRGGWALIEGGRSPSAQTWLLALIVAGRHPGYAAQC